MKRLLFTLFAVMCMFGLSAQTTVYSQDFNGTAYWGGFTTVDNISTGNVWLSSDDSGAPNNTGGTGACADANSDWFCTDPWDTYLYSPAIDVSSITDATVSFKSNFQDFIGSGDAEFSVSTDGVNWTVLYAQTNDQGPTTLTYDVSAYVGGNIYFRWRYDDDGDGCAWYWQIDDLLLTTSGGGGGGPGTSFPTACSLATAIPDNGCATPTTATVTASGLTTLGTTTNIASVDMILTHNWDEDLDVFLVSPAGTVIELTTDNGDDGDNYGLNDGTCTQFTRFTMSASTAVTAGVAPFIGDYIPEGDLNTLNVNGEDPNGVWTLRVCDDEAIITGAIQYFAVNFDVTPPPPTYCTPSVTFVDEFNEFISNFSLNTINNSSLYDPTGYTDYTAISTQIQIGVPYTTTISVGPPVYTEDVMDVWVDCNQDGDFDDAGELVLTNVPNVGGVCVGNLVLPLTTLQGTTRLRVAVRWASGFGGDLVELPCGIMQYGEYEDYTLDVLAAPSCLAPTTLTATNIGTGSATLNWNLVPGALSYDVQYREVGAPTWTFLGNYPDPTNSANVTGLNAQTQYEFQVQAHCSPTDSSGYLVTGTFSTGCFDCPLGSVAEAEACGADANGGCNMVVPTYEPIAANSTVCGTGWATGGTRDTDWYTFTLAQASTVTLDIQSDFPPLLGFLDGSINCANLVNFIDFVAGDQNCTDTTVTVSLCAGTYYAFVAPATFDGFPCGISNNYNITLTVTPGTAGPSNVSACTATALPVGSSCNNQTFTNSGVVYCGIGGGLDPGCGFYQGQDVWFYAIVPASGSMTVLGTAGTLTDGAMGVYTGPNCNSLNLLTCNDDFTQNSVDPGVQIGGLTPGDTVWIQYFQFGGGTGDFQLCAFDCNVVPGGNTPEAEACGDDLNGGCNSVPPVYQNLSCNETIDGTAYSSSVTRDTDWYFYTITTPTVVSWTVQADFPPAAAILNAALCDDQFNPGFVIGFVTGTPCTPLTVTAFLQPGTYAFFVANSLFDDNYGCGSGLNDYIATLNVQMPSPTIGGPTTVCVGDTPFDFVAATAGGQWSSNPAGGFADPNLPTFDPAAIGVGAVDVIYTINQNGCSVDDTLSFNIGDVPAQPATPTGTAQICPGAGVQTYTIPAVSGATSYNWIVTPSGSGATVTNNGTSVDVNWNGYEGTGSIVAEAVNACGTSQASASFDVTILPTVGTAATPVGPAVLCQGAPVTDYVTAGATGADTYVWSISGAGASTIAGNGSTGSVTWDPNFTGTATITVTPSNACGDGTASSLQVSIQVPGAATITAVAPVCDNAAPFNLSGTPAGGTWSGPGITDAANGTFSPSVAGPGNHTITYSPQGGCATAGNTTITVNTVPTQATAPIGATTFCQGTATPINVQAVPVQGATSYQWSFTPDPDAGTFTDNGTSSIINLNPDFCGDISVIIAAENACGTGLFSQPLLITVNCTPAPIIDPAGPFCVSNQQFPLTVDIPNGFWGGCANANGTITPSVDCDVIYTVIVNGCVGDDTLSIDVNPAPNVSITAPANACEGSAPVALSGTPVGGTFSGTNVSGSNFDPTDIGTYTVTYTVAGANGCGGTAETDIEVIGTPTAQFSYSAQCEALTFYNESTGDQSASYFWQFGDGETMNAENAAHVYPTDGQFSVTFTVTNACGTSDTTVNVVVVKCLSVDENIVDDLKLFPNPTNGNINVFFNSATAKNYNISIMDITGKQLFAQPLNNFVGAYNRQIDMTNYAAGIYIFRIMDEDGGSTNIKIIRD